MTLLVGALRGNHYRVKFGSQRHCGSGDKTLLAVEEQDITC